MALTGTLEAGRARARGDVSFVLDAVLGSYAQILFSRSRGVGLLLLLATAVSPRVCATGLLAVLGAALVARALRLSPDSVRSGLFGYNALLVGLGGAALFEPTLAALGLIVVAVVASVFVTATFHSALGATFNLPPLTLPFLLVFYLELAAAPTLGVRFTPLASDPLAAWLALPQPLVTLLHSLGVLFFLPRVEAGLLVLLALLASSRIAVLLALLGYGIARLLAAGLVEVPDPLLPLIQGYNFMLTAVALGGVWFVPSLSSFIFAAGGVLVCALITIGLQPLMSWNGIPMMILPFNLTMILLLYAMRQRVQDRCPKAVDFLLGTPEQNLSYFRTRVSRFGAHYAVRFQAPFLGRWTCTQGVNGQPTHQGPWRFAFDFEVTGPDGKTYRDDGTRTSDFLCHGLPVLAAADGTVVRVVDGVPDNTVGEVNLKDNWGNLVLIYHAPGLYSMTCHLAAGRIKVQDGQLVRQGDVIAACGSSGRSPVPHLHWQLQATAQLGAPTIHAELHDVVTESDGCVWHSTTVPTSGTVVRNVDVQPDLARRLTFRYGDTMVFSTGDTDREGNGHREEIVPDIDLFGNLLLRSPAVGATLFYSLGRTHFTVHDALGPKRSAVHLIRAAIPRLPLEITDGLRWTDYLTAGAFRPWWQRPLWDWVSPFVTAPGLEMVYGAEREGRAWVVRGESRRRSAGGAPLVCTEALVDENGPASVRLTVGDRVTAMHRVTEKQHPTAREQHDEREKKHGHQTGVDQPAADDGDRAAGAGEGRGSGGQRVPAVLRPRGCE